MVFKKAGLYHTPHTISPDGEAISVCGPSHIAAATYIATEAYHGLTDASGRPMIFHPMSVGIMGITDDETVAGILHSILADTSVTAADLYEELPRPIVNTVILLNRTPGVPFESYVDRLVASEDRVAINVAINDMRHSLMECEADGRFAPARRYERAIERLLAV